MTEEAAQYHKIEDHIAAVAKFLESLQTLNPYEEGYHAAMHQKALSKKADLLKLGNLIEVYKRFTENVAMLTYLRLFKTVDKKVYTIKDSRRVKLEEQAEIFFAELKAMESRGEFSMRKISVNPKITKSALISRCAKYTRFLKGTKYKLVEKGNE